MPILSRKKFILTMAGASALLTIPKVLISQPKPAGQTKGPQLDKELVKDFVGFAHKDPEKVKSMLQETPDLLNSVHNLGGWDWEDAIGAAGHVGIPELALFLLEQGARPTICVAAMLGKLDVVRSYINAFPAMQNSVGPHKISLLRHAKAGGEEAKPVYEYLAGLGLKE
jgi:hypothetical protein